MRNASLPQNVDFSSSALFVKSKLKFDNLLLPSGHKVANSGKKGTKQDAQACTQFKQQNNSTQFKQQNSLGFPGINKTNEDLIIFFLIEKGD